MKPIITHDWNLGENDALALQRSLSTKVIKKDILNDVHLVAGADVAYEKNGERLVAAIIVLDASNLNIIEVAASENTAQFPYIPGLFSFRELPPLVEAAKKLKNKPDLIICDSQGIAHPRRLGLASHLGVIFDIPSIGCSKKKLIGEHGEIGIERGSFSAIIDNDEVIGNALRTQSSVTPVYVSIGHKISLLTATNWILRLSSRYRLPETTRMADQVVKATLNKKKINFQ